MAEINNFPIQTKRVGELDPNLTLEDNDLLLTINAGTDKRITGEVSKQAHGGIIPWSPTFNFKAGGYTDRNGVLYRAVQDNTNQDPETDVSSVHWLIKEGKSVEYDTVADMVADTRLEVGQLAFIKDYATGHNSGLLVGSIVASATGTDDGGSFINLANGLQWKQSFERNFVSIKQFGAAPANTAAGNSTSINSALAYAVGGAVHAPAGTYNINAELGVKDKQTFFGDGKYATIFRQSALNTPATMVGTTSGDEYQNIRDFQVQIRLAGIGDVTQRGIVIRGSRRYTLENCMVDNIEHTVSDYGGIGILLDMESVTNAYTCRVINNTVLGCTYGLWSKGAITSSVFTLNHFKTANGMRFDRENVQAGITPIFGNEIFANLIQSHSSSTFGTGNGIDFGQSDGALAFTYAFSNQIGFNYIERFQNGIILRDGSKNFEISSQHWDNTTNGIVDLNADKSGYSGFDAQKFQLSTRDQIVTFTAKGTQHTDKNGGAITVNGTSDTLNIDTNGVVITSDKRRIRLTGNGSPRTGAVLSRASAIEGQRVTLIGFSSPVAFSTTGLLLNGGSGVNLGSGSGQIALIEFEYDSGQNVWVECYRNTRL